MGNCSCMDNTRGDPDHILQSLDGHMTCLDLGRWLSTLPAQLLMELIQLSRLQRNSVGEDTLRVLRTFMVAEAIMRPGEAEPPLDFYIRRLGECASAEYAFRRDWVILTHKLSLTQNPRRCCIPTRTGKVMSQITGPDALITAMIA